MGLCHCYKKQPWLRCHTSQIQIRLLSLAHFPDNAEMASNRTTVALVAVMAMIFAVAERGAAQNCGCSSDLCCSKYGYCGTGDAYCGDGCQQGPCYSSGSGSGSGGSVASIITNDVFNQMVSPASGCEGSGFYTYSKFTDAANAFSSFGTASDDTTNKRELAAFFANAAHETGSFCYINERNPQSDYCDSSNTQYPCASGQSYHGRGPLQLSWNYNYGAAGSALSFDGLNNPGIVATDSGISWKAAVWFWMKGSNCHNAMVSGSGFGATIQAINSGECNGGNTDEMNDRVNKYKSFCSILGVDPGSNLSC